MIINEKTIVVGAVTVVVLYWLAKREAAAAVNAVAEQSAATGRGFYDLIHNQDGSFKWPWEDSEPLKTKFTQAEYEESLLEQSQ